MFVKDVVLLTRGVQKWRSSKNIWFPMICGTMDSRKVVPFTPLSVNTAAKSHLNVLRCPLRFDQVDLDLCLTDALSTLFLRISERASVSNLVSSGPTPDSNLGNHLPLRCFRTIVSLFLFRGTTSMGRSEPQMWFAKVTPADFEVILRGYTVFREIVRVSE
jgi:hypothetical protein